MKIPNTRERNALENAGLCLDWEHRAKLGGEKTFSSLIENKWIEPFSGHNPRNDRFTITDLGREALRANPDRKVNTARKPLKTLPPSLKQLPDRLK